jgi:hypothetical protein
LGSGRSIRGLPRRMVAQLLDVGTNSLQGLGVVDW